MARVIRSADYPDLGGVRQVLVIKLRSHGDVLLSSPVFSVLRQAVSAARLDAYIYKDTLPMLEGHPAISGFHIYDRAWKSAAVVERIKREWTLLWSIRKANYDLVINLTEGDRGAIAARVSGARIRVGWDPHGQGLAFKRRLYTYVVKRAATPRHMVEQNLDALRRIGVFPAPHERELFFAVPDDARETVRRHLETTQLLDRGYILVHPTSRWLFKCWPPDHVAELISRLSQQKIGCVLSCAPDPRELAMLAEIKRACVASQILDLGGKLTLKELGALIELSRCLVCVDSVPMHIAAALKVPTVALFGPSSKAVWAPWNNARAEVVSQAYSCRPCGLDGCGGSKKSDCLETLPVETVFQAVNRALQSRPSLHST